MRWIWLRTACWLGYSGGMLLMATWRQVDANQQKMQNRKSGPMENGKYIKLYSCINFTKNSASLCSPAAVPSYVSLVNIINLETMRATVTCNKTSVTFVENYKAISFDDIITMIIKKTEANEIFRSRRYSPSFRSRACSISLIDFHNEFQLKWLA